MKFLKTLFGRGLLIAMIFFSALKTNAQSADTISSPDFDSEIRQALPNNNYGTQTLLTIHPGLNPGNSVRFLMKYTLPSLPPNSNVLSAKIRIYTIAAINITSSRTVAIHRISNSWSAGNVSWNIKDGANWSSAGGDFVGTPTSTTPSLAPLNWIEFNVTADVITFLSNPESNHGWLIKYHNEDNSGLWWSYASSEYLGGIYAPQLIITYGSTLPITLKSFDANQVKEGVMLNWITSKEKNNEYFELERSIDGVNWTTLGRVHGAGDAEYEINYEFLDRAPVTGDNYYRIHQVDYDGRSSYSHTIQVRYKNEANINWVAYVDHNIKAEIYAEEGSTALIKIYDISGRLVKSDAVYLNKGLSTVGITLEVPTGIYFYELVIDQQVMVQKLAVN